MHKCHEASASLFYYYWTDRITDMSRGPARSKLQKSIVTAINRDRII